MGADDDRNGYFLIHLGRRNAGPRILAEVAKSLSKEGKLEGIIYSKYADNFEILRTVACKNVSIRTYTDKFTFVLSALGIPWTLWRIHQVLGKSSGKNVMFVMHHIWDPIILLSLKIIKKSRIIYWIHDSHNHAGESRTVNRLLVTSALRFADVIVTLSAHVFEQLNSKKKGLRIAQISHPMIFHEKPEATREIQNLQVLFLGRISKYKGLQRLAAAWPIVLEAIPNAQLMIAGDGDFQLVLKLFNNLSNSSTILKYLSDAEISNLMRSSALIVLPYDEASQSGVLVKAVEYGIPYIATPVGGLVEQNNILGGGLIVQDLSSKTFAQGIIEILNKTSEYNKTKMDRSLSFENQIKWLDCQLSEI